ncbi:HAD-like superfamily [Sesbania bispinosa]|nr:HAD-like superfamily [Sesbania bispinosa]
MEYEDRFRQQAQRPKYDCLLFDLDDTLYPLRSGIAKACLQNIKDYMVEKLGIEPSKIDDFFVHGRLPYDNLKPDPVLRNLLLSLPYRKLIFTNADKVHAVKALSRLGLEDCFEGIICFETLNPIHKSSVSDDEDDIEFVGSRSTNPTTSNGTSSSQIFDIIDHFAQPNPSAILPKTPIICKPSENAIELALKIANLDPQRTLFFEDSVRNIQAGKRVGLHTVLVGTSQRVKGADYALESIHNLREAVHELWEADIKSEVAYPGKLAVETSVTA